jgi:hypothetical protein
VSEYGGKGFATDAGEGKLGEVGGEGDGGKEGKEGGVLWFRQTIRNSCGLMALLHAAGNGSAREFVGEFSPPFFLPLPCPSPSFQLRVERVVDYRFVFETRELTVTQTQTQLSENY